MFPACVIWLETQNSGDIVTVQAQQAYFQGQYLMLGGGALMIIGLMVLLYALLANGKIQSTEPS
jgi:hypothetical protein